LFFALPAKGQNKTELSKDYVKAEINGDFESQKGTVKILHLLIKPVQKCQVTPQGK
jgi:hypothetical protein